MASRSEFEFWRRYLNPKATAAYLNQWMNVGTAFPHNAMFRGGLNPSIGTQMWDLVGRRGTATQTTASQSRALAIIQPLHSSIIELNQAARRLSSLGAKGDIVGHRIPYIQMRGTPRTAEPYSARRAAIENPYAVVPFVAPEWGPAASSEVADLLSQQARGAINVSGIKDFTGRRASYDEMYKTASLPETFYAPATQEQAAKWNEIRERGRQGLKERRTRAKYNIWRDSLDDYDRELHDLTKKYAGAPNAREAAENKIKNDALKRMPKFMAEMLKGSNISTKRLTQIAKNPLVARMAQHPIAAGVATAAVGAKFLSNILSKSDEGNRNIVSWQNAANLYGRPSKSFSDAAYLAGVKDPGKISKLYGQLTMSFGNADYAMSMLGGAMKNMPPIARMYLAKSLGLDEESVAIMDIISGRLSTDKARRVNAATNKQAVWKMLGYSSTGSFSDTLSAIGSDATFGLSDQLGARYSQDVINDAYSDRISKQVESAIGSYDEFKRTPSAPSSSQSSTSNTSNVIINGPVNLPNVRDVDGFIEELNNRATSRRAVLNDNDPMEK